MLSRETAWCLDLFAQKFTTKCYRQILLVYCTYDILFLVYIKKYWFSILLLEIYIFSVAILNKYSVCIKSGWKEWHFSVNVFLWKLCDSAWLSTFAILWMVHGISLQLISKSAFKANKIELQSDSFMFAGE